MWVLATRSRPDNCKRFIEAWNQTKSSTDILIRLDDCDPMLEQILKLDWPNHFQIKVGKRVGLKNSVNELFEQNSDLAWYGFLADDVVPRTEHWDLKLVETAGLKQISYPNDLGKKSKITLPTHPCVGGDLVRALGWFAFPATHHFYLDTIYRYIGQNLNCIHRLNHVVVEHMHFGRGKSERDAIYAESQQKMKSDSRAYQDWIEQNGETLIKTLRNQGFGNE